MSDHVISNPKQLSISALIVQLMNSTDYYVNMQLVQFISSCFEMRDTLLSNSWSLIIWLVLFNDFLL